MWLQESYLTSSDEFCCHMDLYYGKDSNRNSNLPLCFEVDTKFVDMINYPEQQIMYFDNFFSSHQLFCALSRKRCLQLEDAEQTECQNAHLKIIQH